MPGYGKNAFCTKLRQTIIALFLPRMKHRENFTFLTTSRIVCDDGSQKKSSPNKKNIIRLTKHQRIIHQIATIYHLNFVIFFFLSVNHSLFVIIIQMTRRYYSSAFLYHFIYTSSIYTRLPRAMCTNHLSMSSAETRKTTRVTLVFTVGNISNPFALPTPLFHFFAIFLRQQ